ncbi:MAG: CCA tRNA nucleotidyltransferase [Dehalococcoidia bacterium]|nr:CCA tRNA nucleotidyltransferase [Dehalococcoidia bacterium]
MEKITTSQFKLAKIGPMNLAQRIEQYLPEQVLELVKTTSKQADKLGGKLYLVGGVVRDLLLGYPNFDLDLVVEGDAVKLAQQIAGIGQSKLVVHPRFGTAKLSYGNFILDMATARSESYAKSGALPTVAPGTLNNDLSRRDFSINAMAISLAPGNYGELIDPYQGRSDLEQRLIRILHPKSFSDDATRILRAIRYEQRLQFGLETQTARLLKQDIPRLDTISGDRIRHELELIFREKHPEHAIKRLGELRALQRLSPSFKGNGWIAEKFDRARCLNKPNQLPPLYFCLLIYQLSERENEQFIRHLNVPKKLSQALHDTLHLKARLSLLDKPCIKASEIYYLLHEYDPLAIQANAIASESSTVQSHLQLFLTKLRYVKTLLNGEELKRLGISSGPEMGKTLQILHKAKLDGEIKDKGDEEKLALSIRAIKEED